MQLSRSEFEYEIARPRGSRSGAALLALSAITAIAGIGLLWGAQHNYIRLGAAALCGFATWFFSSSGRRRRIPVLHSLEALKKLVKRTGIPVALYLRRFEHDERKDHPPAAEGGGSDSDEGQLAEALSRLFLLIAVGRPGEPLPPWGAYRLYIPDEAWKQQVEELIGIASVVIVRCGQSEALQWEIEQIKQASKLDRTMFLLPPEEPANRLRSFLPNDPIFDFKAPDEPTKQRYAAFITVTADGMAKVHDRDLKIDYGESVKRVASAVFLANELTSNQRQTVRGFYGATERLLATLTLLCLYGFIYGLAAMMLIGAVLFGPVFVLADPMLSKYWDIAMPVGYPLFIGAAIVAVISVAVIVLMAAMRERMVPP